MDAAYEAADRAFAGWSRTTPSERQHALLRFADAIEGRARELIELEAVQHGQAARADRVRGDPADGDQIRFFAGAARVLEGKSAGEYMAGTRRTSGRSRSA